MAVREIRDVVAQAEIEAEARATLVTTPDMPMKKIMAEVAEAAVVAVATAMVAAAAADIMKADEVVMAAAAEAAAGHGIPMWASGTAP